MKIVITPDPSPQDPLEWGFLGTMLLSHRRYTLGHERPWWWAQLDREGYTLKQVYDRSLKDWTETYVYPRSWDEREELLRYFHKREQSEIPLLLPVYMFEHSGRALRTTPFGDRWDSGQIGFIFATRSDLKSWYKTERITKQVLEGAKEQLVGEVETYNQWTSGDVWDVTLEDDDGEVIDSTGDIYGFDEAEKRGEEMLAEYGEKRAA